MKRARALALIAVLIAFVFVPPSYAAGRRHIHHRGFHHHGGLHHRGFHHRGFHHHGHHRFRHHGFHHHGFRSRAFIGFGPTYWYHPSYVPRPVAIQQPPIYVQQAPATDPLEPGHWYFCQSAGAYYPTAPSCPEAWVKVAPRAE